MSQGKYSRMQAQKIYEESEIRRVGRLFNSAHNKGWATRAEKLALELRNARESLKRTKEQIAELEMEADRWATSIVESVGLRNQPNSDAHKAWNHLRDAALALPELTGIVADSD